MTLDELRESLKKCCDNAAGSLIHSIDVARTTEQENSQPAISIWLTFFDEDQNQRITASGMLDIHPSDWDKIKEQTPWYQKGGE
tara:strand:- start:379 stop:630 length:252 start_codon:yes stop_codon:yes gene_type:complete